MIIAEYDFLKQYTIYCGSCRSEVSTIRIAIKIDLLTSSLLFGKE